MGVDSLEMLSLIRKTPDLYATLRYAMDQSIADNILELSVESVESYLSNYHNPRLKAREIWQKLNENLSLSTSPEMAKRLHAGHLWSSRNRRGTTDFYSFLGGGTRKEVEKLADKMVLPDVSFKTALVLNYQDVPGRTCALQFISEAGMHVWKYTPIQGYPSKEGGLAMLENIEPFETTVYAVGDIQMALQLQRVWLLNSNEPLKVVVYNDRTNMAWQSINASKVIFWDKAPSWTLFKQAAKVMNSEISLYPRLKVQTPYDYLCSNGPVAILDVMSRKAEPWHKACARWLADKETSEATARDAIHKLEFTPQDRFKLFEQCPVECKERLEELLGENKTAQRVVFNKQSVTEQPDGWFILYQNGNREVICNAVIKVGKEIYDKETSQVIWAGMVRYKNNTIAFNAPLEVIEKDPTAWLRSLVVPAGLGTPIVKPGWNVQLVNLAKTFSNPEAVTTTTRLGLQPNGNFILPHFNVIEGKIAMADDQVTISGVPAGNVLPPDFGKLKISKLTNTHAAYVAIATAYLFNQVRAMKGMYTKPVAVIGSPISTGTVAMRHFAKSAGFRTHVLRSGEYGEMKGLIDSIAEFYYPALLDVSRMNSLYLMPTEGVENLYVVCDPIEASALATSGNWITIQAKQPCEDSCKLPPFELVINSIMELQKAKFEFRPDIPVHSSLMAKLCDQIGAISNQNAGLILDKAKTIFNTPSSGDALIELFINFQQSGKILMDHGTIPFKPETEKDKRLGIVIDDNSKKVYLSRQKLMDAVQRKMYPVPDIQAATADLVRREILLKESDSIDGWTIDQDYWNEQITTHKNRSALI